MSVDPGVNSDKEPATTNPATEAPERPRWWIRRPGLGVVASAILGIATFLVTWAIGKPDSATGATFTYLVILPIALLLPAIAFGGAMVAWHAFRQTRGRVRLSLALPTAIALVLNSAAIAVFLRWVGRILLP